MIIMIIVFLSFASVVSYSLMTMNQNTLVSSEISLQNEELKAIKKRLVSSAIAIQGINDYALPYGQEGLSNEQHLLPSTLNVSLKNQNAKYYQYCPFVSYNALANDNIVSEGQSSTYKVEMIKVNNVDYVLGSTVSIYPEVAAFIISPDKNNTLSKCTDIKYNSNENVYYLLNGKVETIYKTDIAAFNETQDRADKIQTLSINQENYVQMFEIIENDMSNKSYNILLEEDITITTNFALLRNPFTESKLKIDMNGYVIKGSKTILLENFDVYIHNGNLSIENSVASFTFNNSQVSASNVQIGRLELVDSTFSVNGKIVINGKNSTSNEVLKLDNSSFISRSDLDLYGRTSSSNTFFTLFNSSLSLYSGEVFLSDNATSTIGYIDSSSKVDLNNSKLKIDRASGEGFELYGVLNTSNNSSIELSNSSIKNLIKSFGGELNLNDTEMFKSGDKPVSTAIVEETGFKFVSGNAVIYHNSNCWVGDSFVNLDSTITAIISSTDKPNNASSWQCL